MTTPAATSETAPSPSRPISTVGVVGLGTMGAGIAEVFARNGFSVVGVDVDDEGLERGRGHLENSTGRAVKRGKLAEGERDELLGRITYTTSLADLAGADLVVEAVVESLEVKKAIFRELDDTVSPDTILATNTSSLSITEMAADLEHPERVVGFHFFNPVAVMPLLEIVKGERTDDATLATAFATGKALKKTTILVKDSPSFIVNRLLGRFMSEVGRIADAGTPVPVVDGAFAGVAPMPPFVLLSLVGPAIALHNNETLHRAFPERFYVSPALERVVAARKGSYYGPDGHLDPEVEAMLEKPESPEVLDAAEVRRRTLAGLAEEAQLMLDEGVVAGREDLDLAMITGAGFSFWNGGLTMLLEREGFGTFR